MSTLRTSITAAADSNTQHTSCPVPGSRPAPTSTADLTAALASLKWIRTYQSDANSPYAAAPDLLAQALLLLERDHPAPGWSV